MLLMNLPTDVLAFTGLLAFRLLSRKANDRVFCAHPELVERVALKIDLETFTPLIVRGFQRFHKSCGFSTSTATVPPMPSLA